ncbi:hypothetical protein LS684_04265 [Cytobacillus spongiae]|uniref:hypothetical protein n=1 Tax=Cytobacillus spongiae TaxID=2901381 RepID=UPI001F1A40B2|nr:hypothetical protein [Cytobacillus spongiae]UII56686.1 hypothetical protein LS684_04265 [Cytobacillus spongiae]
MLYEVDFTVKHEEDFKVIHQEIIPALSVSDCKEEAERIKALLQKTTDLPILYFIGA